MVETQSADIRAHRQVERAIDELRRQSGIVLRESNQALAVFPVEFADEAALARLKGNNARLRLLLTGARARAAKLVASDTAMHAIQIEADSLSWAQIRALADPLAAPAAVAVAPEPANAVQMAALALAKYASLLPALLAVEPLTDADTLYGDWLALDVADVERYRRKPLLALVPGARAKLPVEGAEDATIMSFRAQYSTAIHLALIIGDVKNSEAPLVRVHSSCVTGDILGSLRCDCGSQLQLAIQRMSEAGGGLLIYLHQEGRGIGITNKLRAYQLQERGIDTYDANLLLGFEEDERDFSLAAAILTLLGVPGIRLLTNNPHKLARLESQGVNIKERVPLVIGSGAHNHAYLRAKEYKAGHLLHGGLGVTD